MRLKKWQAITLGVFAVLDCAVIGIGLAIVATPLTSSNASVSVVESHTQTAQTSTPVNASIPTDTPRPYNTAPPVAKLRNSNIGYSQDLYPCLALDEAASKAMKDLTYSIQTRAIRDRDTCLVAVVSAIATLDKSKSCRQNTRVPDDYDPSSARRYRLDGLETERSALVLLGRTCGTETTNSDIETLFNRSLGQFADEESALKRFFDRYPEMKKLVQP